MENKTKRYIEALPQSDGMFQALPTGSRCEFCWEGDYDMGGVGYIVELPTPEEYERLKAENSVLDDKVARLTNRNRELYASLSNAALYLTGEPLDTVSFALMKASKGERLFIIAGPEQQSKLANLENAVNGLKAELKAVREMRDSGFRVGDCVEWFDKSVEHMAGKNYVISEIVRRNYGKSVRTFLVFSDSDRENTFENWRLVPNAQKADEKKGGQ